MFFFQYFLVFFQGETGPGTWPEKAFLPLGSPGRPRARVQKEEKGFLERRKRGKEEKGKRKEEKRQRGKEEKGI